MQNSVASRARLQFPPIVHFMRPRSVQSSWKFRMLKRVIILESSRGRLRKEVQVWNRSVPSGCSTHLEMNKENKALARRHAFARWRKKARILRCPYTPIYICTYTFEPTNFLQRLWQDQEVWRESRAWLQKGWFDHNSTRRNSWWTQIYKHRYLFHPVSGTNL